MSAASKKAHSLVGDLEPIFAHVNALCLVLHLAVGCKHSRMADNTLEETLDLLRSEIDRGNTALMSFAETIGDAS